MVFDKFVRIPWIVASYTCSLARVNHVFKMTSRRVAWKFFVVFTLMNMSSRAMSGFNVVLVVGWVVTDMGSNKISLSSSLNETGSSASSERSGQKLTKFWIHCCDLTSSALGDDEGVEAIVLNTARVENEISTTTSKAWMIRLNVRRILDTW